MSEVKSHGERHCFGPKLPHQGEKELYSEIHDEETGKKPHQPDTLGLWRREESPDQRLGYGSVEFVQRGSREERHYQTENPSHGKQGCG